MASDRAAQVLPQLFLMVIDVIIKRIMKTGLGFQNEKIYVPALFLCR